MSGSHPHVGAPKRDCLELTKDVTSVIQAIATAIALLAGAWWFSRQGIAAPHANVTHAVASLQIHEKWRLISLDAHIANVGSVPLRLSTGRVYVQRILPLEPAIRQAIDNGQSPIDADEMQVEWPVIGKPYDVRLDSVVAPGESDDYHYEFVVPTDICEVMVHSGFSENSSSHYEWVESSIHKIGDC